MTRSAARRFLPLSIIVPLAFTAGCPMDVDGPEDFVPLLALSNFATNTGGASAIGVRPSDGAVFIVNSDGLFGPIEEGDDVSTLTPIGATNLADVDLFDADQTEFALAITDDGTFIIASAADGTLAVVDPAGGDAAPYTGLIEAPVDAVNALNIFPESLVIVPDNGGGDEFVAGNLLAGDSNAFSRLAAVDVGSGDVTSVDNPTATARFGHFLAFDSAGNLFASRDVTALTSGGIQRIADDGTPTVVANTEGLAANSFVIEAGGDFIIRGTRAETGGVSFRGLFILDSATGAVSRALEIATSAASAADDMVLMKDGTILLSQPNLNRVVIVNRIP